MPTKEILCKYLKPIGSTLVMIGQAFMAIGKIFEFLAKPICGRRR